MLASDREREATVLRLRAAHLEGRIETDEFEDRVLIGETYLPLDRLVAYYGDAGAPGIHLPFNFQLILLPWEAGALRDWITRYETALRYRDERRMTRS